MFLLLLRQDLSQLKGLLIFLYLIPFSIFPPQHWYKNYRLLLVRCFWLYFHPYHYVFLYWILFGMLSLFWMIFDVCFLYCIFSVVTINLWKSEIFVSIVDVIWKHFEQFTRNRHVWLCGFLKQVGSLLGLLRLLVLKNHSNSFFIDSESIVF